ncbi:MAG: ROK family transcriptional regulator, partial [Anaerolineales bacterium]|nr:ROK family transcriptional regulator [Anaerolineales bacterium]
MDENPNNLTKRSATASLMRKLNRSAILDALREHSPIARSEIARQLNISIPTVMRVIDELIAEDLVRWSGNARTSGGRPRNLLEFNREGYAVIGLDLGGSKMYGTLADLGGRVQDEIYLTWKHGDPQDSLDRVCELIQKLLNRPRPAGQVIRGIGVGVPGITLRREGSVTWAPSLGWRDVPLKKFLSSRFSYPVLVENDVNLAALGEYGFGAAKGASSLACLTIGTGIGVGIVIDRQIYRGFREAAGEIGYLPPDPTYLGRRYEAFGALEHLASGTGIEQRAREVYTQMGWPLPKGGLTAEAVFGAARQGESWAEQLVSETGDYLSLAISAISAILDPRVIVLG